MEPPPDIPAWLWVILAAIGGWLVSEAWPFVRNELSANARLRREQELRRSRENEERFVGALERIADAQSRIEHVLERIEQANDYCRENEERFVGALERIAEAQSRIERVLERIEQANEHYLRAIVTTSMQIDEIRRALWSLEAAVTPKDRATE